MDNHAGTAWGWIAEGYLLWNREKKEDLAGWLGDATILANGKSSFGNDDYQDLDSENITVIMKEDGISYFDAFKKYYAGLENGSINRAKYFIMHTPLKEVKQAKSFN